MAKLLNQIALKSRKPLCTLKYPCEPDEDTRTKKTPIPNMEFTNSSTITPIDVSKLALNKYRCEPVEDTGAKETPIPNMEFANSSTITPIDVSKLALNISTQQPLFEFFLDGSRRLYKIGDVEHNNRLYPVIGGQISVSCCRRAINKDNTFQGFSIVDNDAYPVVCLPEEVPSWTELNKLPFITSCQKSDLKVFQDSIDSKSSDTLEQKGIDCIQQEMIECENHILHKIVSKHSNKYLIKDGSIPYPPKNIEGTKAEESLRSYQYIVGVSKKFNPNLTRLKNNKSIEYALAMLPPRHRTPAFFCEYKSMKLAIWYVRIRERDYTATPYSGILKIEKLFETNAEEEKELNPEQIKLINLITANIINERNPVCYGNDTRWANHLYPIYMTECYCKSQFMSDINFINYLRDHK